MEQQSQNLPTSETYEQLRLLAQRLLSPRFGSIGVNPDLTLLPGELPPDLAGALPLPADTRIIGTMLATVNTMSSHPFPRTTCILDVPGERAAVFAHFTTTLPPAGWQAEEMPQIGPPQGGFGYGIPGRDQQIMFRQPALGWLTIRAEGEEAGVVNVRLELAPQSMMSHMRRSSRPNPLSLLPVLPAMPGVTLLPRGSSGGSNRQSSEAILTGPVELAAIQSFYRDRLTEAGWSLVDAAFEGRTAWSTWTFTDEDQEQCHGFLLMFQPNSEQPAWFLRLEAALANDPFAGRGSFSSMTHGPR